MDTIVVVALILVGLALYLRHIFKASDAQPPTTHSVREVADDQIREAHRTLQAAMDVCNTDHPAASQALLWLAASDGTISKQEARNLFRFCEKQGSTLPAGTNDALDYLNNGMSIRTSRTDREVQNDLEEIGARPIQYRAAFLGAAHAICGGNKRISKTKQDFLDHATRLVETSA